jgi:hypothetical protein
MLSDTAVWRWWPTMFGGMLPMNGDSFWQSLGDGAAIAAALTLARLLVEYRLRGNERRVEHEDRRNRQQAEAEARLERVLQDRLADADRRLERFALELHEERLHCGTLEHEHALLQQAHALLKEQHASLQAEIHPHPPQPRLTASK